MEERIGPQDVLDGDRAVEKEFMGQALLLRRIHEPGGLEDQVDDVPWGNTKEDEDDHGHRDERYGAKRQPPREERPHETPYRSSQTSWKRA